MATATSGNHASTGRALRTSVTCSTLAQQRRLTTHERAEPKRSRRQVICQAERRSYGSYAQDWSSVFKSLAEMTKAFEAASEQAAASGRYTETRRSDRPVEVEAEDAERPMVVPVDVEEREDGYSLIMDVPGLQKSDVKVQVFPQQRTITISGERKRAELEAVKDASGRQFRRRLERRVGKFSRTLRLAKDLDVETISARVDKGVLVVTAKKIPAVDLSTDSVEINIQ